MSNADRDLPVPSKSDLDRAWVLAGGSGHWDRAAIIAVIGVLLARIRKLERGKR